MIEKYGLIDISIDQGPNGYWYTTKTAHVARRPGDDDPVPWGESTEHETKEEAVEEAEALVKTIFANGYADEVTIFVEGNEHRAYGETVTYKIGTNRGRPRIWIDGKRLAEAGFVGGTVYFYEIWAGKIVCALKREDVPSGPERGRKVTGRPDGKPIIDMVGSDVETAFPGGGRVRVTFSPGRIVIEREE